MIEFHGISMRYAATARLSARAAIAADVRRNAALAGGMSGQHHSVGILPEA